MTDRHKAEETKARLAAVAKDIRVVDGLILSAIASRMVLTGEVAAIKFAHSDSEHPNGLPISRPEVEAQRLDEIAELALDYGVDPNLARTILSILIDHGCKQQMIRWQGTTISEFSQFSPEELKDNLLELTTVLATGYLGYDTRFPATQAYREYEMAEINRMVDDILTDRVPGLCIDLGCATGQVALALAPRFERVVGIDLSPAMIEQANWAKSDARISNAEFVAADFETEECWEMFPDKSCDLAVMTLGTASDTKEIRAVLAQLKRVLKPGGRFLLSFYNAEGLAQQWGFLPWTPSLAARIDSRRNCLDVLVGSRYYSIYAKAYTMEEVDELLDGRLQPLRTSTYPTLASVLPRELMLNDVAAQLIKDNDAVAADRNDGAYIIVAGRR